jgi:hypothetical protein
VNDFDELPARTVDVLDRRAADAAHTLRAAHVSPPPFDPGRRLPPSGLGVGLMAAMVALVVAAGAMVVAANGDGEPQRQGIAGPVGDLAPLVPTYLPDGLTLGFVLGAPGSPRPADHSITVALYGESGAADPHDGPVLTVVQALVGASDADDWMSVGTEVDLGGVPASLYDSPTGPELAWWTDGRFTHLSGRWIPSAHLVELGELLVSDVDVLSTSTTWELVHHAEITTADQLGVRLVYVAGPADAGTGPGLGLGVMWAAPGHHTFDGLRAAHPGDPGCEGRRLSACGARQLEVRGRPALISGREVGEGRGWHLSWIDPDGRVVTVEAVGLAEAEVVRVAAGLRPGAWDELEPVSQPEGPTEGPSTTTLDPSHATDADLNPGRAVDTARALVGDPRLQVRPVLASRGERDRGWDASTEPDPSDPVTLLGAQVGGWYPGVHDLGPTILDGTQLADAYPLPAPSNAFAVRGDRLWLQFVADAQDRLDELADGCATTSALCPTGRVAVVWADEVIAVIDLDRRPDSRSLTVQVGSWARNRLLG